MPACADRHLRAKIQEANGTDPCPLCNVNILTLELPSGSEGAQTGTAASPIVASTPEVQALSLIPRVPNQEVLHLDGIPPGASADILSNILSTIGARSQTLMGLLSEIQILPALRRQEPHGHGAAVVTHGRFCAPEALTQIMRELRSSNSSPRGRANGGIQVPTQHGTVQISVSGQEEDGDADAARSAGRRRRSPGQEGPFHDRPAIRQRAGNSSA